MSLEQQLEKLVDEKRKFQQKGFSIYDIKKKPKLMTWYTGLQNYGVFKWLYSCFKTEAAALKVVTKKLTLPRNAIKARKLSRENEFFLTLVRLRMGLTEVDLAFRFKLALSTVSAILKVLHTFSCKSIEGFLALAYKRKG